MNSAIDLDRANPPIGQPPLGVEVAAAAARLNANGLMGRQRQPMLAAQPPQVDLAQSMRALLNVVNGCEQRGPMTDARRCVESRERLVS